MNTVEFDLFSPILVVFCLVFIMTMFFASGYLFLLWPSNANTPCHLVVYSVLVATLKANILISSQLRW